MYPGNDGDVGLSIIEFRNDEHPSRGIPSELVRSRNELTRLYGNSLEKNFFSGGIVFINVPLFEETGVGWEQESPFASCTRCTTRYIDT